MTLLIRYKILIKKSLNDVILLRQDDGLICHLKAYLNEIFLFFIAAFEMIDCFFRSREINAN